MIYTIYKITCVLTGKIYIGFTKNFDERMKQHSKSKNNQKIARAIRKYGIENFTQEIIFQSKDGKWLLNEMEPYFIKIFDSKKNGYNSTDGGEGIIDSTGSIASKISKTLMGHSVSKETRKKLSVANLGKRYHLGYKHSELSKEKNRKKHLGIKLTKETKDKLSKNWNFINPEGIEISFRNLSCFCLENNLLKSNMWKVAKGKQKHHKGWTSNVGK